MNDEQSYSASTQEAGIAPSLWNPAALANWSLLLTPLFGSYLLAENYKAMGKPKEAKKAMEWFYIGIAIFLSVILFFPFGLFGVALLIYLLYLISWNFMSARKQQRAVLSEYGKTYERQPWGKVLAIGIAAMIMWQIIVSVFSSNVTSSLFPTTSFDSTEVKQVKSGVMQLCPSHTVDQMVKGFMGSPSWKSGKSADGKVFVNVEGDITFQDKPVRAMVQFIVEGKSFSFSAFEMNGVPSANLIAIGLLNKMCTSAEDNVAEKTAGEVPAAKNSEVTPQPQQTTSTPQTSQQNATDEQTSDSLLPTGLELAQSAIRLQPMKGEKSLLVEGSNVTGSCGTSVVRVLGVARVNGNAYSIDVDGRIIIRSTPTKELIIGTGNGVLSDHNGIACVSTKSGDNLLIWSNCGGSACGDDYSFFVIDPERLVLLAPKDPMKEQCNAECASQLLGNRLPQEINSRE